MTRQDPAFPIGLIALDLDGTLIDEDLVLGPRTLAAISAARERGVAVSIVTAFGCPWIRTCPAPNPKLAAKPGLTISASSAEPAPGPRRR